MNRKTAIAILVFTLAFAGLWPGVTSAWPPLNARETSSGTTLGMSRRLNLGWGEGGQAGAPKPPFTFLEEDKGGTNPKIDVRDARGVVWGVKWGEEVHSEVFVSRLVWAVGYYAEPSYFVPTGKILEAAGLDRAKKYVAADGTFQNARFEKRDKSITTLSDEQSWRYDENPFLGTKELNGLKIMVMLVSNWDSKDQEQAGKGSNTKIFVVKTRVVTERRYVVSDWGGTMGKWGGVLSRGKWDCDGYLGQSDDFVKGVKNGEVEWGYSGQHTDSIKDGIPVAHVAWLLGYLGRFQTRRFALRCGPAARQRATRHVSRGRSECVFRGFRRWFADEGGARDAR